MLKYAKKQIFAELRNAVLLSLLFGLIALYPLYNYEALQNRSYLIVIPGNTPVNNDTVAQLENINGVIFASAIIVKKVDEKYLVEADNNFKIFAQKFLSEGILPENKNSVVYVGRDSNNHSMDVNVGDTVEINRTKYKIVGILEPTAELSVVLSSYYGYDIFIKFLRCINNSEELVVSVSLFANFTQVSEKIKDTLGNNTFVYMPRITSTETVQEFVYLGGSLISWISTSFLLVLWLRKNSVVLFLLGWRKKYVLFEILIIFLIIVGISNLFCYLILYFLTSFQSKYYFYTLIPLLFSSITTVLSMLATYGYSEFFVIRRAVEVLTK